MKIAHIVSTLPPQIGGMGTVAFEEAQALAEHGHQVAVFVLGDGKAYPSDATLPFTIIRLRSLFKYGDAGLVPTLLGRLKHFDVLHLHYPFYGGAEWVYFARIFFGKPYVLTYHMDALPAGKAKRALQALYDRLYAKRIVRRAARVITVDRGHFEQSAFHQYVQPEKIIELSNGVNTTVFTPGTPRDVFADWRDKKVFLFVGNPLPFKRLDFLLQAFATITDPTIVLAVVSDGYAIAEYKEQAKNLGLDDNKVRFVGRAATSAVLASYFNAAQGLIVPSFGSAESFSLVIIEALASGCPVIASDIPGVRARVDDGRDGFLFDPMSLSDLQQKIIALAALPRAKRDALGMYGRGKVIAQYQWSNHAAVLEKVYNEVVSR